MLIKKIFRFEASHQIYNHPGKCARLHGHSWQLTVEVKGPIDISTGMVIDFYDVSQIVSPIVERLDHRHLGHTANQGSTVEGLNIVVPTSECLLVWIANQLPFDFPWASLELNETCTSAAILEREEWLRVSHKPYERSGHETQEGNGKETQESGHEKG
jgi:6-pyruvoyltetrahydropterin/6-carboxytetrahydropterin synthase